MNVSRTKKKEQTMDTEYMISRINKLTIGQSAKLDIGYVTCTSTRYMTKAPRKFSVRHSTKLVNRGNYTFRQLRTKIREIAG
jgi:hypothetical protein